MCAVISICGPPGTVEEETLSAAIASLGHRGPDGEGRWVSPDRSVALGHRRLAVIDIEGGGQPLFDERGAITVAVNGEFYGHRDLRRSLEERGHRFRTRTDAEILPHLYEEHGMECVDRLRGEFAFVLWDGNRRRLFAARDRFGIKPLCYARSGQSIYIASEAKAILALGLPARWDEDSVRRAMSHQYVPPDRTLFDGIRQLPPGHRLVFRDGVLTIEAYWDWDLPTSYDGVPDPERLRHELDEAVRFRLQADVPVAVHLSGGIDSSCIACSAARQSSGPLTCFTVAFPDSSYDEAPIAADVARHIGARSIVVEASPEALLDALPDAVYYSEGLAINGHLPAKYLLARQVRASGFKVVLTGEGADELLLGYPHFRHDWSGSLANLAAANPESVGLMLPSGQGLDTSAVDRALGFVPSFLRAKASLGFRLNGLLTDQYRERWSASDAYEDLMTCFDVSGQLTGRAPVLQSAYLWSKLALANYILNTLGDGTEMAFGVEGRLPFLDHHVFQWTRAVSPRAQLGGAMEKSLLRQAYGKELPTAVRRRRKRPFLAPPQALPVIADHLGATVPFFDRYRVLGLMKSLESASDSERVAIDPVLMTVLSLAVLGQRFSLT